MRQERRVPVKCVVAMAGWSVAKTFRICGSAKARHLFGNAMNEIHQDIRARLVTAINTLASERQLRELRDDINQADADSTVTPDELGELKELMAQAYVNATLAVGGK